MADLDFGKKIQQMNLHIFFSTLFGGDLNGN